MASSGSEWKIHMKRCSLAYRTRDPQSAPERLNSVHEPDEAGTLARIGPADAVVLDHDVQVRVMQRRGSTDPFGVGVLRRVGESFGNHVVRRHLYRLRQLAVDGDIERDRDGRAAGERPQGRRQATGEHRRMDTPGEFMQVV